MKSMGHHVVALLAWGALACGAAGAGCGAASKQKKGMGPLKIPGDVTAVIEGNPSRLVVRVAHEDGDLEILVNEPVPVERFDSVTADAAVVQGSNGRVVMVQKLSEVGEDEFTRFIEVWVIDTSRDSILWTGKGTYNNSFGECETLDVPEVAMENGEVVIGVTKGVEKLEPASDRCESVPLTRNEIIRIELR